VSHAARRLRTVGVVLAVLLAVGGLAACREDTPTVTATDVVTPASAEDFAAVAFHDSTHVDNRWFPLVPGTQMTWVGHALDDDERIERKVVFTVTDLVKEIDGVPSKGDLGARLLRRRARRGGAGVLRAGRRRHGVAYGGSTPRSSTVARS
jgi:hypothetical protein